MENYEQKYKEALGRANAKIETYNHLGNASVVKSICEIFPELKESEDERIRKEIVEYIKIQQRVIKDEGHIQQANDIEEWLVWLEKKCEQKAVSKTEPIVEGLTTEFQKQVSNLIASAMDKEHEYTKGYVEWVAQSLLGYAKNKRTSIDEIKPKFKVKYAGSEYNVLEVKDSAGITFYGIEDEPNHIDYINAGSCEIIDGYTTKEMRN